MAENILAFGLCSLKSNSTGIILFKKAHIFTYFPKRVAELLKVTVNLYSWFQNT